MFSILDTGGNGICCNSGQGSYKVFVDSIEEVSGDGQFGVNKIEHFGSCSAMTTSKPTNMVGVNTFAPYLFLPIRVDPNFLAYPSLTANSRPIK